MGRCYAFPFFSFDKNVFNISWYSFKSIFFYTGFFGFTNKFENIYQNI